MPHTVMVLKDLMCISNIDIIVDHEGKSQDD